MPSYYGNAGSNGGAAVIDPALFNPFPKVKPEDYIAPRRGKAYQVDVPDWPVGAPSVIPTSEVRIPAVCVHKANAPPESVKALLDEVNAARRPSARTVGPGLEILLAALKACHDDLAVVRACLGPAMQFAEANVSTCVQKWDHVVTMGNKFVASEWRLRGDPLLHDTDVNWQVEGTRETPFTELWQSLEAKEVVTSHYVEMVYWAAGSFHQAASGLALTIEMPPFPPALRISRMRQQFWTDQEIARFIQGMDRHGRAFALVARTVESRSTHECVGFYYGLWRKTVQGAEYNRRRDNSDRQRRMEREMLRRDRAWFHMWRFDEEAIGPTVPPAAVELPSPLQVFEPGSAAYLADNTYQQGTGPTSGQKRKFHELVRVAGRDKTAYGFPLLIPNVDIIIDSTGKPFDAPPPIKAGGVGAGSANTAVTTRSAAARQALATNGSPAPLPLMEYPLGGSLTYNMLAGEATAMPSKVILLEAASKRGAGAGLAGHNDYAASLATLQEERLAEERKEQLEKMLREMSNTQHVEPLGDLARVAIFAEECLRSADSSESAPKGLNVILPAAPVKAMPPCSSPLAALEQAAILAHSAAHLPHIFQDSWIDERYIDNESYCALCGDGGDLMCCDGACRRSFHRDCVQKYDQGIKATVKASPSLQSIKQLAGLFDYERDDWRCSACVTGVQECFICGKSGHDGLDVFRCSRLCGKWYHVECLQRDPLTQFIGCTPRAPGLAVLESSTDPDAAVGSEAVGAYLAEKRKDGKWKVTIPPGTSPRFVCPFHTCTGCKTPFHAFHPPVYYRCHACPSAYHASCVPKDAFHDMVDIITCPNKAAHETKEMSALYKGKSGLMRSGTAPQLGLALDPSMLEQMRKNSGGRTRIGDAFERKLANTLAADSGREADEVDTTGQRDKSRRSLAAISKTRRDHPELRTHLELLDSAYYGEIAMRTQALIASGQQIDTTVEFRGVKKVVSGKTAKYLSRIFHSATLVHLGTFETVLEAAVAFDYATTYFRGQAAPKLNFPGSASDCRLWPPIDPWPTYVTDDPVRMAHLPEPALSEEDRARWPAGYSPSPFLERFEYRKSKVAGVAEKVGEEEAAASPAGPTAADVSAGLHDLPHPLASSMAAATSLILATSTALRPDSLPSPVELAGGASKLTRMQIPKEKIRLDPRVQFNLPPPLEIDDDDRVSQHRGVGQPSTRSPLTELVNQHDSEAQPAGTEHNVLSYQVSVPDALSILGECCSKEESVLPMLDPFGVRKSTRTPKSKKVFEFVNQPLSSRGSSRRARSVSTPTNMSETASTVPFSHHAGNSDVADAISRASASVVGDDQSSVEASEMRSEMSAYRSDFETGGIDSADHAAALAVCNARQIPLLSIDTLESPDSLPGELDTASSKRSAAGSYRKTPSRNRRAANGERPKSTYIGVAVSSWNSDGPTRWSARISENNKVRHIGTYVTEVAAACAYDMEAYRLRGSRAILNFEMTPDGPDTADRINMIVKGPGGGIIVRANGNAISVGALAHERQHEYSPQGPFPLTIAGDTKITSARSGFKRDRKKARLSTWTGLGSPGFAPAAPLQAVQDTPNLSAMFEEISDRAVKDTTTDDAASRKQPIDEYAADELSLTNSSPSAYLGETDCSEFKGVVNLPAPTKHGQRSFGVKIFIKTEKRQLQVATAHHLLDAALTYDRWAYALQGARAALNFPALIPSPLSQFEVAGIVLPNEFPFIHPAFLPGCPLDGKLSFPAAEPVDLRKGVRLVPPIAHIPIEEYVDACWNCIGKEGQSTLMQCGTIIFGMALPIVQLLSSCCTPTDSAIQKLSQLIKSHGIDVEKAMDIGEPVILQNFVTHHKVVVDMSTWSVSLPFRASSDVVVEAFAEPIPGVARPPQAPGSGFSTRFAFASHIPGQARTAYTFTVAEPGDAFVLACASDPSFGYTSNQLGKVVLYLLESVVRTRTTPLQGPAAKKAKSVKREKELVAPAQVSLAPSSGPMQFMSFAPGLMPPYPPVPMHYPPYAMPTDMMAQTGQMGYLPPHLFGGMPVVHHFIVPGTGQQRFGAPYFAYPQTQYGMSRVRTLSQLEDGDDDAASL